MISLLHGRDLIEEEVLLGHGQLSGVHVAVGKRFEDDLHQYCEMHGP